LKGQGLSFSKSLGKAPKKPPTYPSFNPFKVPHNGSKGATKDTKSKGEKRWQKNEAKIHFKNLT
jgi:hypothetical protein